MQSFQDNSYAAVDSYSCIYDSALKSISHNNLLWVMRSCPREDPFYGQYVFRTTGRNLRACQTSKTDPRQQTALSLDSTAGFTRLQGHRPTATVRHQRDAQKAPELPHSATHRASPAALLYQCFFLKNNKQPSQKAPNSLVPAPPT